MKKKVLGWNNARKGMLLDPAITYLNTGAFGPLPKSVFDRTNKLRIELAQSPTDFMLRKIPTYLEESRLKLASFLGSSPNQLIFTNNTTGAINLVASSLSFQGSGEILMTDYEYQTMKWSWERVAREQNMTIRRISLPLGSMSEHDIVQAVVDAMTEKTTLFFFSHVLSSTGIILPVKALCYEARIRGIITVIDGAQAPVYTPVHLDDIGCDFYAGSCHKWMLAHYGSGFLYFGNKHEVRLRPMQVSWCYAPTEHNIKDYYNSAMLRSFECEGTRDICAWLTIPTALEFLNKFGADNIRTRMKELADYTLRQLSNECGLHPKIPGQVITQGGIVSFILPHGINSKSLRNDLWQQFGIEISIIQEQKQQLLRVSTHFYNSTSEVDHLKESLNKLL